MKTVIRSLLFGAVAAMPSEACLGQELHSSQNPTHEVHWGVGAGLHSSTNPTAWMDRKPITAEEAARREGQTLKEPVIPTESLTTAKETEAVAKGTFLEAGIASYYSAKTHGRMMASGERYDRDGLFCAHKTLPFGTRIRVVNKKNGKEVVVVVKDRGPFGKGRVVDLSNRAASEIGMIQDGIVPCELWVMDK